MRNILILSAFTLLFSATKAQKDRETIEGNGNIVTKEITVKSFDEIKANGVYELLLMQGDKESVKIEADENLQEYFTVSNEGSKLVIDTEKFKNKNLKGKVKMKVYVSFKKLTNIDIATVGNVHSQNQLAFENLEIKNRSVGNVDLKLTANKLDIENKSVGNVELSGKAEVVTVKNNGVGSLHASDFVVQTMDIENSGVGNASVNAQKSIKVKDSFLGKVSNKGAAPVRKMNKVAI